jgi:putative protease
VDKLKNVDGLYFTGKDKQADGIQVNVIKNGVVIPNAFKEIPIGTMIYKNSDFNSNKLVEREDSATRKTGVSFNLKANERWFTLNIIDEDGHEASSNIHSNEETTKTG